MKTLSIAVLVVMVVALLAFSGELLGKQEPSYGELAWKNAELTEQLRTKQGELNDLRQDIKDGLVPCKGEKQHVLKHAHQSLQKNPVAKS